MQPDRQGNDETVDRVRTGPWRVLCRLAALVLALGGPLAGCSRPAVNFSQEPGFAAWYAAHPPSSTLPGAADQALLRRYQPRIFVAEGEDGPISFYDDYIAEGTLAHGDGRPISRHVTRAILNGHKAEPDVVFIHHSTGQAPRPLVLGRVDRETVLLPVRGALPFTFLTYNVVFRASGLPAGMPGWMRWTLGLIADPKDWHQLDHYTAVCLALTPDRAGSLVPVAATFQEHNYQRTYLLGATGGPGRLALPADGRLAADAARQSNELYPHVSGRHVHRAVPFMTPSTGSYLVMGRHRPWLSADDITEPAREVETGLGFLPPADAFYVFQGWLGARRLLPGRSGPPGADYNTLPAFKAKATQMMLAYWHEDDPGYLDLLQALFRNGRPTRIDLAPFARRFVQAWQQASPGSTRIADPGG